MWDSSSPARSLHSPTVLASIPPITMLAQQQLTATSRPAVACKARSSGRSLVVVAQATAQPQSRRHAIRQPSQRCRRASAGWQPPAAARSPTLPPPALPSRLPSDRSALAALIALPAALLLAAEPALAIGKDPRQAVKE